MTIPNFPTRTPLTLDHRAELHALLSALDDGLSEHAFANLFLFRSHYSYEVTRLQDGSIAIHGAHDDAPFWIVPQGLPADEQIALLCADGEYIKCIVDRDHGRAQRVAPSLHYAVVADRDNFDYLYRRSDMAELRGRKFHKKRNLLNYFRLHHEYTHRPLTADSIDDAEDILRKWREEQPHDAELDSAATEEAIRHMDTLSLHGYITHVFRQPAGFTLGETLANGAIFVVHFEKAVTEFKGIFQFINHALAAELPEHIEYINREQDLGDAGLRQAKLTYRPIGFVKKYCLVPHTMAARFAPQDDTTLM